MGTADKVFFFQAEDGIRDLTVTGVQTCALPICVIVAGRLHAWDEGQVLPHEGTRQGPKQDRLALMRATSANISPLWLLYDDGDRAVGDALVRAWTVPPTFEVHSEGETHALRAVTDLDVIRAAV